MATGTLQPTGLKAERRFYLSMGLATLAVVVIGLPPLRERNGDVALLAQDFLRRSALKHGKRNLSFTRDALRAMHEHSWPGNVRELENRVRRSVIMAERKNLSAEDLELGALAAPHQGASLKEARENVEREMIEKALRKYSGKIAPAAMELCVSRPTFYELMEKLGIRRGERELAVA